MLLVAEKGRENEVFDVFSKWGLDATIVGTVIAEPRLRVLHKGELDSRHPQPVPHRRRSALPPPHRHLEGSRPARPASRSSRRAEEAPRLHRRPQEAARIERTSAASAGSSSNTIRWCRPTPSKAPAQKPESCASRGRNRHGSPRHGPRRQQPLVLSRSQAGSKTRRSRSRPQSSLHRSNAVAATNCLNFGNPEKPEIMAQLSEAIDGIAEACTRIRNTDHRRQCLLI